MSEREINENTNTPCKRCGAIPVCMSGSRVLFEADQEPYESGKEEECDIEAELDISIEWCPNCSKETWIFIDDIEYAPSEEKDAKIKVLEQMQSYLTEILARTLCPRETLKLEKCPVEVFMCLPEQRLGNGNARNCWAEYLKGTYKEIEKRI